MGGAAGVAAAQVPATCGPRRGCEHAGCPLLADGAAAASGASCTGASPPFGAPRAWLLRASARVALDGAHREQLARAVHRRVRAMAGSTGLLVLRAFTFIRLTELSTDPDLGTV